MPSDTRIHTRREHLVRLGALAASPLLLQAGPAFALDYPSKPVRLVVPFLPGGAVDVVGRTVGKALGTQLGTSVIIDNKPGASGMLGTDYVIRSAPDGYTLLVGYDGTLVINPAVTKVPYNTLRDLVPVTRVINADLILAISPKLPVRTYADLVAYSRRTPVTFGSSGTASTPHMFGELLKIYTGINLTHVPYKGAPAAIADVIGGHIGGVATTVSSVDGFLKSGQLRGIIITGTRRSPAAPDTATVTELGFPEANVSSWFGILSPAGTPRPIVDQLNREIVKALRAELGDTFRGQGFDVVANTPDQFREDISADLARWVRVAREANIRLE